MTRTEITTEDGARYTVTDDGWDPVIRLEDPQTGYRQVYRLGDGMGTHWANEEGRQVRSWAVSDALDRALCEARRQHATR